MAEKLVFMLVKMYFCVLATEQLCSVASTQKIQISNVVLASKLIKGTEYRKLESNLMNVIDLANWISQRNLSQKRIRTGWREKKKKIKLQVVKEIFYTVVDLICCFTYKKIGHRHSYAFVGFVFKSNKLPQVGDICSIDIWCVKGPLYTLWCQIARRWGRKGYDEKEIWFQRKKIFTQFFSPVSPNESNEHQSDSLGMIKFYLLFVICSLKSKTAFWWESHAEFDIIKS